MSYVHQKMPRDLSDLFVACREPINTISMDDSFSPLLHRIEQAVRWRAIRPNDPLPPPSEKLTQLSKPPSELRIGAQKYLDRIIAAADVKKGDFPLPC